MLPTLQGLIARAAQRRYRSILTLALLLATIAVPLVVQENFHVSVIDFALIFVVMAIGLQLIVGYAGQLTLAQAAFFGVGAYASTILTKNVGLPFLAGVLAAGLAAGLCSLLMAPIVRLRGHYFAVATMAFGITAQIAFANGGDLTGGWMGISGVPAASVGPWDIRGSRNFYLLLAAIVWVQYLVTRRMIAGRFGRALRAIRDNDLAAECVGINGPAYKITAIAVGSGWAGVAGSLMAHFNSFVNPEPFSLWQSITMLLMVVVGGVSSLPGAVIGAISITVVDEVMRGAALYRPLLYGAMVVMFMIYLPEGIAGLFRICAGRLTRKTVDETEPDLMAGA